MEAANDRWALVRNGYRLDAIRLERGSKWAAKWPTAEKRGGDGKIRTSYCAERGSGQSN
jgi:hypothetical protein